MFTVLWQDSPLLVNRYSFVIHGKTIKTNCNLKVAFSLNSWIYNKTVIIQLTVQYRNIIGLVPR